MEHLYARLVGCRPLESLARLRPPHPAFDQGSPFGYGPPTTEDGGGHAGLLDLLSLEKKKRCRLPSSSSVVPAAPPREGRGDGDTFLYHVFSAVYPEESDVLLMDDDATDVMKAIDRWKQDIADAVPRMRSDPGVRQRLLRCFRPGTEADDVLSRTPEAVDFVADYVRELTKGGVEVIEVDMDRSQERKKNDSANIRVFLKKVTRRDGKRNYELDRSKK